MLDIAAIAASLLLQVQTLLPQWLPAGKLRGHEYLCGNLRGDAGDSLSINVKTGLWMDFASGEKGGDLVSLYAAMHGLTQVEAATKLGDTVPMKAREKKRREVIMPVPVSAVPCDHTHYQYGKPSGVWEYRGAAGELLGYVARYDPPEGKKQIVPWTYGVDQSNKPRWSMGQWAEPRPLYGLDELAKRPDAPVLIVEGEKAADAARQLAPSYVVVTWPGGSQAWKKTGWSALQDRSVLLWPDSDNPGHQCMLGIGKHLTGMCEPIKFILADDRTDGWDAADAVAEGWTWERFKEWAVPRVKLIDEGGLHATSASTAAMATGATAGNGHGSNGNGSGHDGNRSGRNGGAQAPAIANEIASTATPAAPHSRLGKQLAWNLESDTNHVPYGNLTNAVAIIEHDPYLKGTVWYDEFLDKTLTGKSAREWKDYDDVNLVLHIQREVGLMKMSRDIVSQAIIAIAYRDVRNCVKDWLGSLKWDGVERIEHFFEDNFGAAANAYTRAAARNFWLTMVARIYNPGCKVDNMIVLEGAQGLGKSRALQVIGGEWFTEQHESATNPKGFGEVLQGKLLIEIAEMDSFSRAEVTRVKAVISNPNDRFRGAYKRYAEDHMRTCVFVGTTNKDDWNRDETGARRFWPIRCVGEVDVSAIAAQRDQLFAEAVERFKAGATWWEMPGDETREEQRKRYDADAWGEPVQEFIGLRSDVTVNEILTDCLKKDMGDTTRVDQMRVAGCLRALGWVGKSERRGHCVLRVWRPASDE